jgi:hypothetical protein
MAAGPPSLASISLSNSLAGALALSARWQHATVGHMHGAPSRSRTLQPIGRSPHLRPLKTRADLIARAASIDSR